MNAVLDQTHRQVELGLNSPATPIAIEIAVVRFVAVELAVEALSNGEMS